MKPDGFFNRYGAGIVLGSIFLSLVAVLVWASMSENQEAGSRYVAMGSHSR